MTGGESRIRPNREQQEEEDKKEKEKEEKEKNRDTYTYIQKVAREKMKSTRRSKRE